MRNWPKASPNIPNQRNAESQETEKPEASTGLDWSMRRSSSQAPLHLSSSPASENSYIGEFNVNNGDLNSEIYAETESDHRTVSNNNSVCHKSGFIPTETPIQKPKYSDKEGLNPRKLPQSLVLTPPSIPSSLPIQNVPGTLESSSSVVPNSALCSNLSYKVASILQPKTKETEIVFTKEDLEKTTNSISSRVQFQPIHLNVNTSHKPSPTFFPNNSSLMPLQLLPKHLNADHHSEEQDVLNSWNLSVASKFMPQQNNNCPPILKREMPTVLSKSVSQKGIILHSPEINSKSKSKPLPPLPSRRVNGPKRKN